MEKKYQLLVTEETLIQAAKEGNWKALHNLCVHFKLTPTQAVLLAAAEHRRGKLVYKLGRYYKVHPTGETFEAAKASQASWAAALLWFYGLNPFKKDEDPPPIPPNAKRIALNLTQKG